MKTCIVGGGLCGLTSAVELSSDTCEVDLFEEQAFLGGCLASYTIGSYQIERYYHHCFSGDTRLMRLLNDLGIADRLEWLRGSTGYYVDGTIYPLTTPGEILRYPHLSLLDKARLAWLTLRSRNLDVEALDSIPAKDFILKHLGTGVYASFFEPLLKSKFGDRRDEVSAAWLISRIAIRSNRGAEGERLGYPNGGFQMLIDRLESSIQKKGGNIYRDTPVRSIRRDGGKWLVDGQPYDTVIATIPPQRLATITGMTLPEIPYQGAACMTLALDADVAKGIYWLNMKDDAPYGAVVSHTNFAPIDRYGEHIIYLASYFTGRPQKERSQIMLADFCRRFGVKKESIHWHRMAIDPCAGPVYTTGLKQRLPAYEQHGLYTAGMFSPPNYPERSMEGSIVAAHEVVSRIRMVTG